MSKGVKYIETGIVSCPLLPENWKIKKLKYLAKVQTGRTPSIQGAKVDFFENGEINWFTPADFGNERFLDNSSRKVNQLALDNAEIQLFPNHSIYLVSIGATLGKIGISEKSGSANQQINVISFCEDINPVFGFYFLKSISSNLINEVDFTTLPILNQTKTKDIFIPFPSIGTQEIIAKFLDQKTTELDNLISKKQKLIDCLKEEKEAIINQVVTKGIQPNVEMKDSGVDWLGEIPKHWEVKKLKYVLAEKNGIKIGPFGSSLKLDTLSSEGVKVYGQGNIIQNDFEIGNRFLDAVRFENDFKQYLIEEGDVLVTMMGTTGKAKVFTNDLQMGIIDSHLIRLRLNRHLMSNLMLPILIENAKYISAQMKIHSRGSIMEGLNSSIIKDLKLCIAPIDEQKEIVNFIHDKILEIDKTINKIKQEIDLINEYRAALINEAVTGKITLN